MENTLSRKIKKNRQERERNFIPKGQTQLLDNTGGAQYILGFRSEKLVLTQLILHEHSTRIKTKHLKLEKLVSSLQSILISNTDPRWRNTVLKNKK